MSIVHVFDAIDEAAKVTIPDAAVMGGASVNLLAVLLANVRRSIQSLQDAAVFVEDELVKAMEHREQTVPGVGQVVVHSGAKRTEWDHAAVVDALVHVIGNEVPDMIDLETGEVHTGLALARTIGPRFTDATGLKWKITKLREYRLDPGDYCRTTWGRKTIEIKAPNGQPTTTPKDSTHDNDTDQLEG